ncbi:MULTISPECIES: PTS sugar transporter subunit IIC [Enterococcus]|uniref:Permease IIC component n=1 Tax=Enterococcus thailandicus TaxID=417368 RepID=A0A179ETH4_ENTTH|nr:MULTISPECIES: PTS sugar transporter subunit IIC [Enterococcus]ASZ08351.1 PTS cellobiose transporter subunit IIC [Enterococcus thailandicus]MDA3965088.1 PTS sugar transporter subunit IIC [Enterococcus thailandicus]MDT2752693.1 PTS sugar transporter subunit IIC [Enterococcus thailandicus]MDT2776107.1 PTS sugar transporter subunit IIC [Enterococcus thailandicus]MDT2795305.1 PTS sugar transporter subunit IIC [Enterococcus thailandicus]
MNEWINEKVLPPVLKFVNTKPITALRNGMLYTMPFTIVGSVFLLLANFPVTAVSEWVNNSGLAVYFNQAYGASFAIMAIFAVVGIAYSYVKDEGFEGLPAGMIALVIFLLTMRSDVTDAESGVVIGNVIDKGWTGGQGMISAILVGLFVGWGYTWFLKRDIRIKLPEQVPDNVANSFTALIPAAVLITFAMLVYIFFDAVFSTTMIQWIYEVIQSPMQGVTDSLGGALMLGFLVPFLWFFGVHGSTIVGGIMGPILQANSLANTEILESGKALTVANGGHIVTQQFLDQFMTVTGAGMTIGVVMFMVFFAKSAQFKQLGRLSLAPAIFNINEPIIFATPIVMNPIMAIPFIATPVVSGVITYFALYTGLVPLFTAVQVPWTTPPIISGFLVGGWQAALLQTFVLAIGFFIYLPFVKKIDAMNYAQENDLSFAEADQLEESQVL